MAELKTKQTEQSVDEYIDAIADDVRRQDCRTLIDLMSKATAEEPRMWGTSMVGFGSYHYKYDSGHEGDAMLTGFASRKPNLTLYAMPGEGHEPLLARLGKHKAGKGCLYVKRLADVDLAVLTELVTLSVEKLRQRYN
jgi:hypothetical protein